MSRIDLSHPITAGMPVYPGDPPVITEPALTLERDGAAVSQLSFGTHTGTHLDAPSHVIEGGRTVDQLDLDLLQGEAYILQATVSTPEALRDQPLGIHDLMPVPDELPGIVCIATGWDQHFHKPDYAHHPYLELELIEVLWHKGARVLGVDTLSPDRTSEGEGDTPVHELWLGRDGVLVENLRGLRQLPPTVELTILPLPLAGLDGSPVRAITNFP